MKIAIYLFLAITFNSFAQVIPIVEKFIPEGNYSKDQFAKVAVLQWAPEEAAPIGDPVAARNFKGFNIDAMEVYIKEAALNGAELIITPEFGIVGYPDIPELPAEDDNFRTREDIQDYVETVPGPATRRFSKIAKELGISIHFGMAERDKNTDKYYNTVVAIGSDGKILARYRKQHLYQIEHNYLSEGTQNVIYNSDIGRIGIIICSDVYDDHLMDLYATQNLQVLAMSTSWAHYNTGWNAFVRGAKWVNAFFLAANHSYFPDSGVINPDGSIQSHIRQSNGLSYGFIPRVR